MDTLRSLILGTPLVIQITLRNEDAPTRPKKHIRYDGGSRDELVVLQGGGLEGIGGEVVISPPGGKPLDHAGIKVELIGEIHVLYGGSTSASSAVGLTSETSGKTEFTKLIRELEPAGTLERVKSFRFSFRDIDPSNLAHESYSGSNVRLTYFIRVTVSRTGLAASSVSKDQPFWVVLLPPQPKTNASVKTDVGIDDCLLMDVEFAKERYSLKDMIRGTVTFRLVRVRLRSMEIAIQRKETTRRSPSGEDTSIDADTLCKFQIMDGCPSKGEQVPIRIFLAPITELTPTYRNVHRGKTSLFSIRYYLNVVLLDEANRRYFKQFEISLYRKEI